MKGKKSNSWNVHEKRIKDLLKRYYEEKNYLIDFNKCYNTFDVVCAKIKDEIVIEELIGIEIKSDRDQLNRLRDQLIDYIRLFDKIYIALESKNVPEFIPPYIGIIRCNEKVHIEREAQRIYFKPELGNPITYSAISNTIKESGGIQSRSKEVMISLEHYENIKRKLLYNAIFKLNCLPFSHNEKKFVTYIDQRYKQLSNKKLFTN